MFPETLEKQLANQLGIRPYHAMDINYFERVLEQLKIKDVLLGKGLNVRDKLICGACHTLVRNLQNNAISLEILGTAICNIYFSMNRLLCSLTTIVLCFYI